VVLLGCRLTSRQHHGSIEKLLCKHLLENMLEFRYVVELLVERPADTIFSFEPLHSWVILKFLLREVLSKVIVMCSLEVLQEIFGGILSLLFLCFEIFVFFLY
jgi:hypothetical protein